MSDPAKAAKNFDGEKKSDSAIRKLLPDAEINSGAPAELTPEEQMALYEKDLKENDWGHQPC